MLALSGCGSATHLFARSAPVESEPLLPLPTVPWARPRPTTPNDPRSLFRGTHFARVLAVLRRRLGPQVLERMLSIQPGSVGAAIEESPPGIREYG